MKKLGFVFFSAIILLLAGCSTTKAEKTSIQALIKQGKIDEAKSFFLTKSDIKATFDIYDKVIHDRHTEYVYLNKTVVLLPYSGDNKFIAIGVLEE